MTLNYKDPQWLPVHHKKGVTFILGAPHKQDFIGLLQTLNMWEKNQAMKVGLHWKAKGGEESSWHTSVCRSYQVMKFNDILHEHHIQ